MFAVSTRAAAALRGPLASAIVRPTTSRAVLRAPALVAASSRAAAAFSTTAPTLKKGDNKKKADKGEGGKAKKGKGKAVEEEAEEGMSAEEIDALIAKADARMGKAVEWAKTTVFNGVERGRGRVTPSILDGVKVQLPDQGFVPLKSLASITVKANVLVVDVWDATAGKHVESALHSANLPGISPQRDGNSLRLPVARPTADVRKDILRTLHEAVEQGKSQVRLARTDALKALGGRGAEGTDDIQKATDKHTADLEKLQQSAKKELA